jgi:hypothetical protein
MPYAPNSNNRKERERERENKGTIGEKYKS